MSSWSSLQPPDKVQVSKGNGNNTNDASSSSTTKNTPSYRVTAMNELSQNKTYLKISSNTQVEEPSASGPYTALGTAGSTFMGYSRNSGTNSAQGGNGEKK